jgi:hypothetical protein
MYQLVLMLLQDKKYSLEDALKKENESACHIDRRFHCALGYFMRSAPEFHA